MFRRLSRRIVLISLLTISICTLLIGIFSYQWAKKTVRSEFMTVSSNYYRNSNELIVQHMNYIEETAKVILNNPIIDHELEQTKVSTELQPVMDNLSSGLDVKLLGISFYKTNGTVYSLSRMSDLPTLDKLREDETINRFMDNAADKSKWTFRQQNLPYYYTNVVHSNGTLSYLLKAFRDNGSLLGMMVVDLDANKLFDFFSTDNALFRQNKLFLLLDGQTIGYPASDASRDTPDARDLSRIKKDPEGSFVSAKGDMLVLFQPILNSATKMVMNIPLNNSASMLQSLQMSILLYTLMSSSLAVVLAILLQRSIVRPLNQLYKRIKTFI